MLTTFLGKTKAEFEAHASTIVKNRTTASNRKAALAYLQMTLSKDRQALKAQRKTLKSQEVDVSDFQTVIDDLMSQHSFDYSKQADLFTSDPLTAAEFIAALATQNNELYIGGLQITGNVAVTGQGVLVDGESLGKSARTEQLTCTAKITGQLQVNASDCVFRGIHFQSATEKAIVFAAGVRNVTFQDCIFTAPAGNSDSKWFCGSNLGGNITITNCLVQDFTGWLLADFSSTSGEPQQDTDTIKIKRCFFKNNAGSMASRGKTGARTKFGQFNNNKCVTNTIHAQFWDFIEINGCKRVEIQNNYFEAPSGQEQLAGKKGVAQVWSKTTQSDRPWTVKFAGNEMKNIKVGLKVAHNTGFRAPDADSPNFEIDISQVNTNCTYPVSFLYKNNDGSTASNDKWLPAGNGSYTPDNATQYPSVPAVTNPNSYTIVQ